MQVRGTGANVLSAIILALLLISQRPLSESVLWGWEWAAIDRQASVRHDRPANPNAMIPLI
jgi:hypothetical protein